MSSIKKKRVKTKREENKRAIVWNEGRTIVTSITDEIRLETVYTPEQPVYYGKVNAFVLEIFAMKQKMKLRESRNFIEAAFESFPDLEYCVILLPSNHVFIPLLHHFVVRWTFFPKTLMTCPSIIEIDRSVAGRSQVQQRLSDELVSNAPCRPSRPDNPPRGQVHRQADTEEISEKNPEVGLRSPGFRQSDE